MAQGIKNRMHSDITTLESQLKVIKDYRKLLCRELKAAIRIFNQLNKKKRAKAFGVVNEVNHIRRQIYEKALGCGYVKQCIDSIPTCKGECCKWHFPKNLSRLDLFITICSITGTKSKWLGLWVSIAANVASGVNIGITT